MKFRKGEPRYRSIHMGLEFVRDNERLVCGSFDWWESSELALAFGWKPSFAGAKSRLLSRPTPPRRYASAFWKNVSEARTDFTIRKLSRQAAPSAQVVVQAETSLPRCCAAVVERCSVGRRERRNTSESSGTISVVREFTG
jgi:hypothetical protein